jgi:hypothetical protein
MDIEGGEKRVLEGMQELKRRNTAMLIIMEVNIPSLEEQGCGYAELETLLLELGFSQGLVVDRRMESFALRSGLPRSRIAYNMLLY